MLLGNPPPPPPPPPPLNWGKNCVHIGADIRPKKTQSENHCKYLNSVLQTLTKFVLFSNQTASIAKVGQKRSYTTSSKKGRLPCYVRVQQIPIITSDCLHKTEREI